MSFNMPVSDFIALCVIVANYDLNIPIDELMLRWEKKLKPKRKLRFDQADFPDYVYLFAITLQYIRYSDINIIDDQIHQVPKQNSIFSEMTLNQWIKPMSSETIIGSTDGEDLIFNAKFCDAKDDILLDKEYREHYTIITDEKTIRAGCFFNQQFRKILTDPACYQQDKIGHFLRSNVYAQKILELWTTIEIASSVFCMGNQK